MNAWIDWQAYLKHAFGSSASVTAAIAANPVAFFAVLFSAYPTPFRPPWPRAILPIVRAIPEIDGTGPYALIADSAKSFCTYTDPDRCRPVELLWSPVKTPEQGIDRYLRDTDARIIVVSGTLFDEVNDDWRAYLGEIIRNPAGSGGRITGDNARFIVLVSD